MTPPQWSFNVPEDYHAYMVWAYAQGVAQQQRACPHCGAPLMGTVPAGAWAEPNPHDDEQVPQSWRDRPALA